MNLLFYSAVGWGGEITGLDDGAALLALLAALLGLAPIGADDCDTSEPIRHPTCSSGGWAAAAAAAVSKP